MVNAPAARAYLAAATVSGVLPECEQRMTIELLPRRLGARARNSAELKEKLAIFSASRSTAY